MVGVILRLIGIVVSIVTTGVAFSVSVAPSELSNLCILWFAYPYLVIALACWTVILFTTNNIKTGCACLIVLAINGSDALNVIGLRGVDKEEVAKKEGELRLLTYNVRYFAYNGEMKIEEMREKMADFIERTDADIVCLQEVPSKDYVAKYIKGRLSEVLGRYRYVEHFSSSNGGELLFSKYKTEATGYTEEKGIQAIDITIGEREEKGEKGEGKLRVYNCHLASLGLSDEQINAVSVNEKIDTERRSLLRGTYERMMEAFRKREKEVDSLKGVVEKTEGDVIVCGDFNDTPISYTYWAISHIKTGGGEKMTDRHESQQIGLHNTYRGKLPPLRIDFVFTNESMKAERYREYDLPYSDHRAVVVDFRMRGRSVRHVKSVGEKEREKQNVEL